MSAHARLTLAGAGASILAALSLGAVLKGGSWTWHVLLVVGVVVGAGALARRVGIPTPLVPLVSAVALLVHLTVVFAHDQAWLWIVPTPEAARTLGDLLADGSHDVAVGTPPAPVTPGLLVLTVIGVGLTAILVDTLAVTYRRAALAGLALLGVYTVPASLAPSGVGWGAFVLAGLGYLVLLLVDAQDRVSRWGRAARRDGVSLSEPVQTSYLLPGARRVGATALALGVVAPLVLPAQAVVPWSFGTGAGRGQNSSVRVDNPILDLRDDLVRPANRQVLSYTTDDTTPGYLRVVTLDSFSGDTWSPSVLKVPNSHDVTSGLPRAPGLSSSVPSTSVRTVIDIGDLQQRWLPLPYPPTRVDIDGLWLYDLATFNVFSTRNDTLGLHYDVTSLALEPTAALLRAAGAAPAGMDRYLQLPGDLPDSVRDIAADVVAGASTDYDRALALQDWLRDPDNFRYDTTAPDGTGVSAIEAFLTRRSGFCVHFASTMAVMARTLGIPARVDVGFTPGRPASDGSWSVSSHDAHAWPELFFSGVGWVAFEPTPAVRTGDPPTYARRDVTSPDVASAPSVSASATSSVDPRNDPGAARAEAQRRLREETSAATAADTSLPVPWMTVTTALVLGLLAFSPLLARTLLRRRRLSRRPDTAAWARDVWRELRDSACDLGYSWPTSQTTRQATARLIREGRVRGEAADALARLGRSAERARYAASVGEVGDLVADYRTVVASLAARCSRSTRLWARLAPSSMRALLPIRRRSGIDEQLDEQQTRDDVDRRVLVRSGSPRH